jgi:hypothetical protein
MAQHYTLNFNWRKTMTNRTCTDVVLTNTSLGYKYAARRIQECFVPPAGDAPKFYGILNPRIEELMGLVRAKFSDAVDIYPTGIAQVSIRPHSSNVGTAIASWDGEKERYIIHSLRVRRVRRVRRVTSNSLGVLPLESDWIATGIKDCKRAASFIAGLLSYTDTELAAFVVQELGEIVKEDVEGVRTKLAGAFSKFKYKLDSSLMATEILEILDCIAQNKPAYMPENGSITQHYNTFAAERKQLEEKANHVGELTSMFMFRAARNNTIVLVAPRPELNALKTPPYTKSYNSFDDLPQEIKRVVMTLEVKEKDPEGRVEGVGIVAEKGMSLCNEACGFAVPIDTLNSFILEVEGGL